MSGRASTPAPTTSQTTLRPPTEYRITARATANGEAAAHAAQVTIPLDATWATPPSGLPGPADLLATAFAACLLKNLARAGTLLGFSYDDAEVEVTARRQDSPPKFTEVAFVLRVTTDEPQRRIELLQLNLSKYGTVYNTLAAACEVHGTVVATPRASSA